MGAEYQVVDLFAGCGGLSQGLEKAGFRIVAANEFWKPAQLTYVRNHPTTKFFPGDITAVETKNAIFEFFKGKKCHVIAGGPPCQAYSTAGRRDPNDPRGRLFEDYVEIVDKLRPDVFIMENVKGILTMEHDREDLSRAELAEFEEYKNLEVERSELLLERKRHKNNPERFAWGPRQEVRLDKVNARIRSLEKDVIYFRELVTDQIVRRFKKIGYTVQFKLLNAADYGVPQKRQRVIFLGTRHNIPIVFPSPTHSKDGGKLKKWVTVKDAIDDLKTLPEDKGFNHILTEHDAAFKQKIIKTPIGSSVFGGYSDAFFKNQPDEPARTVKENHGGVLVHYARPRVMTPRELARLQSFPDRFIFESSKSNILKQIGNAVPVGLAAAIGGAVKEMLTMIPRNSAIGSSAKVKRSKLNAPRPVLLAE